MSQRIFIKTIIYRVPDIFLPFKEGFMLTSPIGTLFFELLTFNFDSEAQKGILLSTIPSNVIFKLLYGKIMTLDVNLQKKLIVPLSFFFKSSLHFDSRSSFNFKYFYFMFNLDTYKINSYYSFENQKSILDYFSFSKEYSLSKFFIYSDRFLILMFPSLKFHRVSNGDFFDFSSFISTFNSN